MNLYIVFFVFFEWDRVCLNEFTFSRKI